MDGVRRKVADLRRQTEEKDDRIAELAAQLEEEKSERQKLEEANRSLEYKLQKASEDLEYTEEKLENAERTKTDLETNYTDTTNYTKNQVDVLARDLDIAQTELESYKSRCKEAEEGRESAEREVGVLNSKLDRLEDQVDTGRTSYTERVSQLEEAKETAERRVKELERLCDELEKDLEIADQKYDEVKSELESTLAELTDI